jgi:hypothetical protein
LRDRCRVHTSARQYTASTPVLGNTQRPHQCSEIHSVHTSARHYTASTPVLSTTQRPHQCSAIHSVHTSSRQYTASSLTYTWENVAGPKCSTDLFVLYNSEIICCHILLAYMNIGGGLEATLESRKVRQASFIHSFIHSVVCRSIASSQASSPHIVI